MNAVGSINQKISWLSNMDIERVLRNLKIASKLSQNDKLVTEGVTFFIRPPGVLRTPMRIWYGESREHCIVSLRSLFSEAINILALRLTQENKDVSEIASAIFNNNTCTAERLIESIKDALQGCQNLLHTYSDDISYVARLQVIIQDTEEFLEKVTKENPNLTPKMSP